MGELPLYDAEVSIVVGQPPLSGLKGEDYENEQLLIHEKRISSYRRKPVIPA
ncbi:MAG: hypothetical protein LHV69_08685 [Elusimicrobia bacterium]|nr:hypothetical protein [Candidatus Obscuribacterium magneticum]